MANPAEQSDLDIFQLMLSTRLTESILVRRIRQDGSSLHGNANTDFVIATNVPPLRNASRTGFDFGNDGPGAQDLSLACVQAVLQRMDYVGPLHKAWDGSRVYELALDLQTPFLAQFVAPPQGDELRIAWNQALGWVRRMLLDRVRQSKLTTDVLLNAWRRSVDGLPDPPPEKELDRADVARQLRRELLAMTGDASVLAQFLGMVG